MAAPRPLTLCPPAQLDWSRPGTPAALKFGDIYFSTDGGLDETRTVFLKGCGLPEVWQNKSRFVIAELGFGSGLNFLATWQMWEETARDAESETGFLHFVSIEKYPFDREQLARALEAWPELKPYAAQLIAQWPGRVRGFHRLHFGRVTLTLIHDDIVEALDALSLKADAWFLDGFSPAKNPEMWSADIMARLVGLSKPGARLATFTVAGEVRRALSEAGFTVERKTGFGRKRHRLEARLVGTSAISSLYSDKENPIILGAGIAGISLAQAFLRRGVTPRIIEDKSHIAASGNQAALVKPRLDLQDRPESRFFLSSYLYAIKQYEAVLIHRGITHLAKNEHERERHQKLIQNAPLPTSHLSTGETDALFFPSAVAIHPGEHKAKALSDLVVEDSQVEDLSEFTGPIFLAAGFGVRSLLPDLPLRFSRGQITYVQASNRPDHSVTYGGYAVPLDSDILIGATHDRLIEGENPFDINPVDDRKNIAQFESYIGEGVTLYPEKSRASIRVTSHDTLPIIGEIDTSHYILSGLGSRGFVFAPLLAEALLSHYYGDPLPIARQVWEKLSVARLHSR